MARLTRLVPITQTGLEANDAGGTTVERAEGRENEVLETSSRSPVPRGTPILLIATIAFLSSALVPAYVRSCLH